MLIRFAAALCRGLPSDSVRADTFLSLLGPARSSSRALFLLAQPHDGSHEAGQQAGDRRKEQGGADTQRRQARAEEERWLQRLYGAYSAGTVAYAVWALAMILAIPWVFGIDQGEVQASLDLDGESHVQETGISGVWRVDHFDAVGETQSRFVEVTFIPAILRAQPEDAQLGLARLAERLEQKLTECRYWQIPLASRCREIGRNSATAI